MMNPFQVRSRSSATDVNGTALSGAAGGALTDFQDPMVISHRPQLYASGAAITGMNSLLRFRTHDATSPLGSLGAIQQGFSDPQAQLHSTPQRQLNEYMANLTITQERLQRSMVGLANLASGYGRTGDV